MIEHVTRRSAVRVACDDMHALSAVVHIAAPRLGAAGRADYTRTQFGRQIADDALVWQLARPRCREHNLHIGVSCEQLC